MKNHPSFQVRGRFAALCVFFLMCSAITADLQADDRGQFDGAVWTFGMKSKGPRSQSLRGMFRVSDDVLYQKKQPGDVEFSEKIGTNHPKGDKTRIKFTNLRGFAKDAKPGRTPVILSGNAQLSFNEFGEWEGRFIDSSGQHWDFKCSRVKE